MNGQRRIVVSLPADMLEALDGQGPDRNAAIREAVRLYLRVRRRQRMRAQLKAGYTAMGAINLALAEEAMRAEGSAEES